MEKKLQDGMSEKFTFIAFHEYGFPLHSRTRLLSRLDWSRGRKNTTSYFLH